MLTTGKRLDGRYVIREQIGSGGFGAVFLAEDARFNGKNLVAVKQILQTSEQIAKSFRREADLLYNLSHPNLPKVTNCFQEDGANYIVMDYISGEDLAQKLTKGKRFSLDETLKIADTVLDALEYLHSVGIFHRDIKPHNIKIDAGGRIYLLDFGTAKGSFDESKPTPEVGQSITGFTPFYAPLEQVLRVDPNSYLLLQSTGSPHLAQFLDKQTDQRSDIYTLGATLYHLLTGRSPEKATSTFRAFSVWSGKPDPLPQVQKLNTEVSPDFANVIYQSLALEPENRFQTAKEFRNALKNVRTTGHFLYDLDLTTNKTEVLNTSEPVLQRTHASPTAPQIEQSAAESIPTVPKQIAQMETPPFQIQKSPQNPPAKSKAALFGGLTVGIIVLFSLIGLGTWLFLRTPAADEPSDQSKQSSSPENPPPKTSRSLTYSLLVQKMRDGKKYQEPFESSGQEIFENGYQFQMRFTTPSDKGYFYVFAEGLNDKNEKVFNIIFPTPKRNAGKSEVSTNRSYETGWNEFGGTAGTENFWIVWSKDEPEAAEKARENAFQSDTGEITDKNLAANLKNYLEKNKADKANASKDTDKKLTKVEFGGDSTAYLMQLEHR